MPLKYPSKGGTDFQKVSAGLHVAVCYLVVDVGLQPGSPQFPDPKRQLRLQFEVPGETIEYEKDGKTVTGPTTIGTFFTASMNPKANLRKQLESWRGKKFSDAEAEEFDVASVLGKPCQIQVMHTDDGKYANIVNVLPAPKGCKNKATNKLVFYSTDEDAQFNDLPKWLQEKVTNQLGPEALQKAPLPLNQPSAKSQESASKRAAFEPSRTPDVAPSLDPNDEIPFAPRGKRSHWE